MALLDVRNLNVSAEEKEIIRDVTFHIRKGEIVVLMGPNGSGKSSLAYALMGHPQYSINHGTITLNEKEITRESADTRARAGLFLGMQQPVAIPGVKISQFLRSSINTTKSEDDQLSVFDFQTLVREKMKTLGIDTSFLQRFVNEGFSGGEQKKAEILQLLMLQPQVAVLDEPDSGLDIDAVKIVAQGIKTFHDGNKGVLLITHYTRILKYLQPDRVLVMREGQIIEEGTAEVADRIENQGYDTKSLPQE